MQKLSLCYLALLCTFSITSPRKSLVTCDRARAPGGYGQPEPKVAKAPGTDPIASAYATRKMNTPKWMDIDPIVRDGAGLPLRGRIQDVPHNVRPGSPGADTSARAPSPLAERTRLWDFEAPPGPPEWKRIVERLHLDDIHKKIDQMREANHAEATAEAERRAIEAQYESEDLRERTRQLEHEHDHGTLACRTRCDPNQPPEKYIWLYDWEPPSREWNGIGGWLLAISRATTLACATGRTLMVESLPGPHRDHSNIEDFINVAEMRRHGVCFRGTYSPTKRHLYEWDKSTTELFFNYEGSIQWGIPMTNVLNLWRQTINEEKIVVKVTYQTILATCLSARDSQWFWQELRPPHNVADEAHRFMKASLGCQMDLKKHKYNRKAPETCHVGGVGWNMYMGVHWSTPEVCEYQAQRHHQVAAAVAATCHAPQALVTEMAGIFLRRRKALLGDSNDWTRQILVSRGEDVERDEPMFLRPAGQRWENWTDMSVGTFYDPSSCFVDQSFENHDNFVRYENTSLCGQEVRGDGAARGFKHGRLNPAVELWLHAWAKLFIGSRASPFANAVASIRAVKGYAGRRHAPSILEWGDRYKRGTMTSLPEESRGTVADRERRDVSGVIGLHEHWFECEGACYWCGASSVSTC